ncbi:hypothetical protein FGG08_000380 [Glutinoglossum americanum]|uniref:Carboxylesterase type B domain-containing protein n=1 Tax=Glutinoglossum americanum TaxID=1670608 RepID=A0A9P8L643_9PEZI|nr:hypothetical protein FGG08_000380 [Glutinoglossum americanum]
MKRSSGSLLAFAESLPPTKLRNCGDEGDRAVPSSYVLVSDNSQRREMLNLSALRTMTTSRHGGSRLRNSGVERKGMWIWKLAPSSSNFLGNFPPTIDETLVFSDYDARSLAGNFIQAVRSPPSPSTLTTRAKSNATRAHSVQPVLIGNTDYEVGIIGLLAPAAYAALSPAARTAYNLVFFACPTAIAAFRRALHDVPTWRYRWFGEYTNTHLFPGSGAWHGSEIGFVFGTTEELTKMENEKKEEKVQK